MRPNAMRLLNQARFRRWNWADRVARGRHGTHQEIGCDQTWLVNDPTKTYGRLLHEQEWQYDPEQDVWSMEPSAWAVLCVEFLQANCPGIELSRELSSGVIPLVLAFSLGDDDDYQAGVD